MHIYKTKAGYTIEETINELENLIKQLDKEIEEKINIKLALESSLDIANRLNEINKTKVKNVIRNRK